MKTLRRKDIATFVLMVVVIAVTFITTGCQTGRGLCADLKGTFAVGEEILTPMAEKAEASDKVRVARLEQHKRDRAEATLGEYNQNIADIQSAKQ